MLIITKAKFNATEEKNAENSLIIRNKHKTNLLNKKDLVSKQELLEEMKRI
jgi:hypothetical protein